MRVKDLIAALAAYDPETEVFIPGDMGDMLSPLHPSHLQRHDDVCSEGGVVHRTYWLADPHEDRRKPKLAGLVIDSR